MFLLWCSVIFSSRQLTRCFNVKYEYKFDSSVTLLPPAGAADRLQREAANAHSWALTLHRVITLQYFSCYVFLSEFSY